MPDLFHANYFLIKLENELRHIRAGVVKDGGRTEKNNKTFYQGIQARIHHFITPIINDH